MSRELTAAHWARAQLERVHDDPAGRLALLTRTYRGPIGRATRHLPFRRAAMSFMRWQVDRGVLGPLDGNPPGSRWWRAVNDRLLVDGCEAMARSGGLGGELTLPTIGPWMSFIPRLGMAGAFLSLRRVLPDRYPLDADVHAYLARENGLGRMLDYGVIGPRLQVLYEWSARELDLADLRELVRDGSPIYAWSYSDRYVWIQARESLPVRILRLATSAR